MTSQALTMDTSVSQANASLTSPRPSLTAPPRPADLAQAFEIIDGAAINMDGVSFHVNYRIIDGTLDHVITMCFDEPDCISFDYNGGQRRGWFHK